MQAESWLLCLSLGNDAAPVGPVHTHDVAWKVVGRPHGNQTPLTGTGPLNAYCTLWITVACHGNAFQDPTAHLGSLFLLLVARDNLPSPITHYTFILSRPNASSCLCDACCSWFSFFFFFPLSVSLLPGFLGLTLPTRSHHAKETNPWALFASLRRCPWWVLTKAAGASSDTPRSSLPSGRLQTIADPGWQATPLGVAYEIIGR